MKPEWGCLCFNDPEVQCCPRRCQADIKLQCFLFKNPFRNRNQDPSGFPVVTAEQGRGGRSKGLLLSGGACLRWHMACLLWRSGGGEELRDEVRSETQCVLLEGDLCQRGMPVYPAGHAESKAGYQNPGVGSNYCQRTRRDETEELLVTQGRTGNRPIKPEMLTLIMELGLCCLQQRLLFLKTLECVCFNKANLFCEHVLSSCYVPSIALSINIQL